MIRKFIITAAALAVAGAVSSNAALADRRDDIKARGKLIVGVSEDFRPFGFRDEGGDFQGLEVDLAKDLAKRLGVELELVPVKGAFRKMQAVYKGEVDLTLAGLGDTPKRREEVAFVEPHYYVSGYGVLAAKAAGLKAWADLKGKKVCSVANSWYDKFLTGTYGAELVSTKDHAAALEALRKGNCVGVAYDNTLNSSTRLSDPEKWADYEQPLPTLGKGPWGIAIENREATTTWGQFLTVTVQEWHKSGLIIELEKKYGIKPEPWLDEQKAKFQVG